MKICYNELEKYQVFLDKKGNFRGIIKGRKKIIIWILL